MENHCKRYTVKLTHNRENKNCVGYAYSLQENLYGTFSETKLDALKRGVSSAEI